MMVPGFSTLTLWIFGSTRLKPVYLGALRHLGLNDTPWKAWPGADHQGCVYSKVWITAFAAMTRGF